MSAPRENPGAFAGLTFLMFACPPLWILLVFAVFVGRVLQGVGRLMRS